jgi:hypothetical protein
MLHRRRRSGPANTSTLPIAQSLAPVQTPLFAPVLTSPINSKIARRPSAEGYDPTPFRRATNLDPLTPRSLRLSVPANPQCRYCECSLRPQTNSAHAGPAENRRLRQRAELILGRAGPQPVPTSKLGNLVGGEARLTITAAFNCPILSATSSSPGAFRSERRRCHRILLGPSAFGTIRNSPRRGGERFGRHDNGSAGAEPRRAAISPDQWALFRCDEGSGCARLRAGIARPELKEALFAFAKHRQRILVGALTVGASIILLEPD